MRATPLSHARQHRWRGEVETGLKFVDETAFARVPATSLFSKIWIVGRALWDGKISAFVIDPLLLMG